MLNIEQRHSVLSYMSLAGRCDQQPTAAADGIVPSLILTSLSETLRPSCITHDLPPGTACQCCQHLWPTPVLLLLPCQLQFTLTRLHNPRRPTCSQPSTGASTSGSSRSAMFRLFPLPCHTCCTDSSMGMFAWRQRELHSGVTALLGCAMAA